MEPIGTEPIPFCCLREQLCLGLGKGQWIWAEGVRICLDSKWELVLNWASEAGEERTTPLVCPPGMARPTGWPCLGGRALVTLDVLSLSSL